MTTTTTARLMFISIDGSDDLIRSCLPQIERLLEGDNDCQLPPQARVIVTDIDDTGRATRDLAKGAVATVSPRGLKAVAERSGKPARPSPTGDLIVERLNAKLHKPGDEVEVQEICTTPIEREMCRTVLKNRSKFEFLAGNRWGPSRIRLRGPFDAVQKPAKTTSPAAAGGAKFKAGPQAPLTDAEKNEAAALLLRMLPHVGAELTVENEIPHRLHRAAKWVGFYDTRFNGHDDADKNRVIKRAQATGGVKKQGAA